MSIKREKFRGKFYIVVRNDKGQFQDRRKWTRKYTLEQAKRQYKEKRALKANIVRTRLTKKEEIRIYGRKSEIPKRDRGYDYQYFAEVTLKTGDKRQGWSAKHNISYPQDKARDEAYTNLYTLVAYEVLGESDADLGEQALKEIQRGETREGVIYFKPIKAAV